jgi:HSP20 family protein
MTTQSIPIKLYRTPDRITVAAPMPGLGPEDIHVQVDEHGLVRLEGRLCEREDCGALKHSKDVLEEEWTVGPYLREISMPSAVDGEAATVTYGNGVLVVSLPVAERNRAASLTLETISPSRGLHRGDPSRG